MPPRSRSRVPVGTYGDSCDGCRSSPSTIGRRMVIWLFQHHEPKTFGPRAFAIAGPQGWNNVSMDLHDSSMSYREFCSKLKTYLYCQVIWKHSNLRLRDCFDWEEFARLSNSTLQLQSFTLLSKSSYSSPTSHLCHLHISLGWHPIIHTLCSICPNHLNLPCLTTSTTLCIPKRLQIHTALSIHGDTLHIHLTIIRSVLSRLCRFSAFITHVSVPYVNTLWTQALYILPFMRYDAPRAVRIRDNSLNLTPGTSHSGSCCLLHTTSCTTSCRPNSKTWKHIPTSHWVQSQPLWAKLIGNDFPPSISCKGCLFSGKDLSKPWLIATKG